METFQSLAFDTPQVFDQSFDSKVDSDAALLLG